MNSSRDHEPAIIDAGEPRSRRQLLTAGGVAAIAGVLGVFGLGTPTAAANGDPVRAGKTTKASGTTKVQGRKGTAFVAEVTGSGRVSALRGQTTSAKGKGVSALVSAKSGSTVGVEGLVGSPKGTAGRFVAGRGGTALVAESPDKKRSGVALRTVGQLQFKRRSGMSETSGGSEFVIPVTGGLKENSMVLATLQDHVPGVHVESASVLDADGGLIVVRLNQAVAEPTRVAWFVLD